MEKSLISIPLSSLRSPSLKSWCGGWLAVWASAVDAVISSACAASIASMRCRRDPDLSDFNMDDLLLEKLHTFFVAAAECARTAFNICGRRGQAHRRTGHSSPLFAEMLVEEPGNLFERFLRF